MSKDKTEYMRQWRKANPDAVSAKNRRYYLANRERIIERNKAYYKRNHVPRSQLPIEQQEEQRAFERLRREAHREEIKAWKRKYYNEVLKPRREAGRC